MKPIMARCADLCGAVERLTRATDAHRRAETLAMRGTELRVRREALARSLAPAQVLRAHGHLDADALPATLELHL